MQYPSRVWPEFPELDNNKNIGIGTTLTFPPELFHLPVVTINELTRIVKETTRGLSVQDCYPLMSQLSRCFGWTWVLFTGFELRHSRLQVSLYRVSLQLASCSSSHHVEYYTRFNPLSLIVSPYELVLFFLVIDASICLTNNGCHKIHLPRWPSNTLSLP